MQDSGSQGGHTVSGRIIARVNPPPARSDGAYRMEFGFITQAMLDAAGSVSAAIAANNDLLPSGRFMTEANWLRRAQARNRAWAASSLIRIPIAASGGGQAELQGRVIARWNPNSGGPFRVEFGFLPEWAIAAASIPGDSFSQRVQKAAAQHAVLPRTRYLSESRIAADSRRSSPLWRPSSVIQVPLGNAPPTNDPEVRVTCSPGEVNAGAQVTCQATASGGTPPYSYSWSAQGASPSSGSGQVWRMQFPNEGNYSVQVTVTDSARQRGTAKGASVRVTSGPEVRVTCSPGEVNAGAQVTCQAAASGGTPPHVTYSWSAPGAIPPVGAGPSWSGQFPSEGTHRVQVTVTDSARQTGTGEAFVRVTMPPPPTVRIISCSPNEGERPPGVTCQAAASGGTPPYSYSWSAPAAVPPVGSGQTWSPSFPNAGTHRVQVTVTDSARQRAEDSASVTITPPPTVEASCTPEEVDARDTVTCWAQASGGTPPYTYSWSARGAVPPSGSELVWRPQFPSSGEYTVQVTVTDSARQPADDSTSVTVGREPLTVQVDCSPERVNAGDTVTCWATPRGGTSPYTYSWNARGATPSSGSGLVWSGRFANAGTYSVQATVTDSARQQADDSASVTLVGSPPTVQVDCSPRTIDRGNSTSCRATAEGGAGGYTYRWSAPGGSPSSDSGQSFRPRFDREGSYTVRVTVTDRRGASADDDERIDVRPEPVEVTASCSPTTIDEGDSTNCTATARRGAGGYTYQWRSGSANPRSGSDQSYRPRFNHEGNYTVRVTATDSRGASAEDTVRIEVRPGGGITVTASCSPRTVDAGDRATCRAEASGGAPPYSYVWTAGGRPVGQGASFTATYQTTTDLQVTVVDSRRARGEDRVRIEVSQRTELTVTASCSPTSINAPGSIQCRGQASGGSAPYTYTWTSNGQQIYRGPDANRTVNFSSAGTYRLQLAVTDRASDRASSRTVTVRVTGGGGGGTLPPPPPIGFGRCGDDGRSVYYFNTSAGTRHHLSITWEAAQRIFPGWSERWIGWLSQADCNQWTLGRAYGETEACRTEHARCR